MTEKNTLAEKKGRADVAAMALPAAAVLFLAAFGVAAWWSWHHSPLSDPIETPRTRSAYEWLTSAVERNAAQHLPYVRGDLQATFSLPGTEDVWVAGDGGLILHSPDAGETWEVQPVNWQGSPPRAPAAAPKAARNAPSFGFSLIATAQAQAQEAVAQRAVNKYDSVDTTAQIQRLLGKLGYGTGVPDGLVGPATEQAIRAYQRSAGMKEDGAPSDELVARLQKDVARRPTQTAPPPQTSAPEATPTPITAPARLYSIAFSDRSHGIAGGADGALLITNDGGLNWFSASLPTRSTVRAVRLLDEMHAIAVLADGKILLSANGGIDWDIAGARETVLRSLDFVDSQTGLIGGAQILGTNNGGQSWRVLNDGKGSVITAIRYAARGRAAALIEIGGIVLLTNDAGATWDRVSVGVDSQLNSLAFGDPVHAAIVGDDGVIALSDDGGRNWRRVNSGVTSSLHSVAFVDVRRCVAVGSGGTLLVSRDAGHTWAARTRAGSHALETVKFAEDGRSGIAVGYAGLILRSTDGGATWNRVVSGTPADLHSVARMGTQWVVVGDDGTVLTSADGGATWARQQLKDAGNLMAVEFVTPRRGVTVGPSGTLLLTVDGGANWSPPRTTGKPSFLLSVAFFDGLRGVGLGDREVVALTRDGGDSWVYRTGRAAGLFDPEPGPTQGTLISVAVASNERALAVDTEGGIWVTRDAGETWRSVETPTRNNLSSVDFADGTHGIAVGNNETVLLTTDGGQTWFQKRGTTARQPTPPEVVALLGVDFINTRTAVAVGEGRTILRSTDGGQTWAPVSYSRYPAPWTFILLLASVACAAAHRRRVTLPTPEQHSVADLLVSDRPLLPGEPDLLNFGDRARQMSRFLRHEQTDLPVTLAITAEWGRGKSSLMNLLAADLGEHGFRPVWFNAWHHEKEGNLLASLLQAVREQALPRWWNLRGFLIRVQLLQKRSWLYLVAAAIPLILVLSLMSYFYKYPERWQSIGANVKFALNINRPTLVTERTIQRLQNHAKDEPAVPKPWIDLLGQYAKTAHQFNNPDELLNALRTSRLARTQPLSSELGNTIAAAAEHIPPAQRVFPELGNVWTGFSAALAAFIAAVTFVLNGMSVFGLRAAKQKTSDGVEGTGTRKRYSDDFKRLTEVMGRYLVVMIDDLDRCSRKSLLDMFEHINFLATEGRCSIIIGIAYERVIERLAITLAEEAGRKREKGAEESDLKEADFYLHKLIQLRLAIPKPADKQLLQLFTSNSRAPTPWDHALVRGAKTAARQCWPWIVIGVLAAGGAWIGRNWIGEVYPQPTSEALERELLALQPAPASAAPATGTVENAIDAKSGEAARPSPLDETVRAALLPGLEGVFPALWVMVLALVSLLAALLLMLWRDPVLRMRILARVHKRWRNVFALPVRERDSQAFLDALTIWHPLAAAASPSPRDLKRTLNRLRFEVMSAAADCAKDDDYREPHLAALAALRQFDESLTGDAVSLVFDRALESGPGTAAASRFPKVKPESVGVMLHAARAHTARFGRAPNAVERTAFLKFVG